MLNKYRLFRVIYLCSKTVLRKIACELFRPPKMRNLILLLILAIALILPSSLKSQVNDKNYQFLSSLNTGLQRKMYANEIMFDQNEQYLIVNYGNKPTYIVVFEYGLWQPIVNFRLPNWVEFSGAYIVHETKDIYIKASRYNTEYYKLNIDSGEQEIRECETLPAGCPVVEPKQSEKTIFSKDKSYFVAINKKNARDVKVFQKR